MSELPQNPMIQGEKVWLRAMEKRDLPAFLRGRNDLRIGHVAGFYFPESSTALEQWYGNLMTSQHGKDGFYFTICRLGGDELVGFIWLWHLDYHNRNAEVSIFLSDAGLLGNGFGTDATRAILDFGFTSLPLERIYLLVRMDNAIAVRSYEKVGMVVEGTLRKAVLYRGRMVDKLLMSILREEWAAQRES